jgi:hypothetical protein
MAILYGTTADGDSLPVEVNELGQLVAEGLPGQQGPPGPPGIGQLPPDPFEGAILGWKDNTLSWLGGATPLPVGTYGPITEYQGGVLTLADAIDLPYLAQFFLSNNLGAEFSWSPSTSLISNVTGNVLQLTDDANLANFRVGDVVQEASDYGSNGALSGTLNRPINGSAIDAPTAAFDGSLVTRWVPFGGGTGGVNPCIWTPTNPIPYTSTVEFYIGTNSTGMGYHINGTSTALSYRNPEGEYVTVATGAGTINNFGLYNSNDSSKGTITLYGIRVDGVLLIDNPSVKVTSISTAPPSITTDGGNWRGTDGSGDPDGEQQVVGPETIGQGSVQSSAGNAIVLREDNGGWKIGEYITTVDMELAARYVVAAKRRKNTEPLSKER